MPKHTILYIDDDRPNLDTFKRIYGHQFNVLTAISGEEGLSILKTNHVHLLVADQRMPGMTGVEVLEKARVISPHTIRMVLTAYTDIDLLLNAIKKGRVYEYVTKPWDEEDLTNSIKASLLYYEDRQRALEELIKTKAERDYLKEELDSEYNFREIIGASGGLKEVIEKIKKVSQGDSTVLIQGESGSGKELVARAIHYNSPRKEAPFIKVNCTALSPTLLESELFGHEKGAFTGAIKSKPGRFELANHGTLFLDEIGDLTPEVQVKLLRVLQEQEFERVGGIEPIAVDTRIIAATNRSLEKLIKEGRFREDLFFRLNVIPVSVPPLRDRPEDLKELTNHILEKCNRKFGKNLCVEEETIAAFNQYDWPGNIRELQNMIERAVVLASGPVLKSEDFVFDFPGTVLKEDLASRGQSSTSNDSVSYRDQLGQKEIEELKEALDKAKGNISKAAKLLNIPRTTLHNKLKKYGLI